MTDIAHCSLSITSITLWPSECNSLVTTLLIVIETVRVRCALLVSLVSNPAGIVSDFSDCLNNEVNPSLTYKRDYLDTAVTLSKGHLQGMHSVSQCDQYIKNISSPHKSNAMET